MVRIEPWGKGDLALLRAVNAPEMTQHLGGPEIEEKVVARHHRYVALNEGEKARMFRIVASADEASVGSVGYWDHEWNGATVAEVGWMVLPPFQGRGIAVAAMRLLIDVVRAGRRYQRIHAFPNVENAASNAVCRRLGFTHLGEVDFEYPKGNPIRSQDWCLDLAQAPATHPLIDS
jgi:RimJ/RimL family protein N-acetyltransferase